MPKTAETKGVFMNEPSPAAFIAAREYMVEALTGYKVKLAPINESKAGEDKKPVA